MRCATRSDRLRRLALPTVLATLLALTACGGGGDSGAGVATLDDGSSKSAESGDSSGSKQDDEAELQKWVECMRDQGIDLPDPSVDDQGNLTLRPQGPPAGGDDSASTDSSNGAGERVQIDRESMDKAREQCGNPPEGALGGFDRGNSQEFQDRALKFAQCMRDNGVDVPDPQFDQGERPASGDRPTIQNGGPLGANVDPEDPTVQKAMEACRSELGDAGMTFGAGPGGPDGGPSNSSAAAAS